MEFQFHMVRLKVIKFPSLRQRRNLFQFHMVRLKETIEYVREVMGYDISIPHGTIKSPSGNALVFYPIISIPHGTIKRL